MNSAYIITLTAESLDRLIANRIAASIQLNAPDGSPVRVSAATLDDDTVDFITAENDPSVIYIPEGAAVGAREGFGAAFTISSFLPEPRLGRSYIVTLGDADSITSGKGF